MFMYHVSHSYSIIRMHGKGKYNDADLINTLLDDLGISAEGFLIACLRIHGH